jgi:signal transduction histidine kinase
VTLAAFVLLGFGAASIAFWQHIAIVDRHNGQFSTHYRQQMVALTRDIVSKEVQFIRSALDENGDLEAFKARTLERLRKLRFGHNDNGYFFVLELLDPKGGEGFAKELLLPIDPAREGQLLSTRTPDTRGRYYRETYLHDLMENGEAIAHYTYLKPDINAPAEKISYLTRLDELGWVIGAGFYLDDLAPILEQEAKETNRFILQHSLLVALAILAATALVMILYTGAWRALKGRFERYEAQIHHQNDQLLQKERLINENAKVVATGEMLKMVAHHWRQPLNTVSILIQDLADAQKAGELDERYLRESIQKAMVVVGRMSETIDSFRNFLSEERSGAFDLKELAEHALILTRPELEEAGIALELIAPDTQVRARGSSALFGRIIIALLLNAKEAIAVSEARTGHITLRLQKWHQEAVLEVIDSGPGVAPDQVEQIFLPYFTTKEPASSNGLGLYMARKIIEDQMQGQIRFINTPGSVTVKITLPAL